MLALLHPVMPHVTEEIWSQFHGTRLIVSPWPEPDTTVGDARALDEVQRAAATFRRSGVLVALEGEEEKRIFDAVVKPERAKANGDAEAERQRLRKEIARAEGMLANDRFVDNAPPELVEAEREKVARFRRDLEALGE
jgi:valyl-tRNA synthetase